MDKVTYHATPSDVDAIVRGAVRLFEFQAIAHERGDLYQSFWVHSALVEACLQLHVILGGGKPWFTGTHDAPPLHVLNRFFGENEIRYFNEHIIPQRATFGAGSRQKVVDWFLYLVEEIKDKLGLGTDAIDVDQLGATIDSHAKEHALHNFRPVLGTRNLFRSPWPFAHGRESGLDGWLTEHGITDIIDLRRPDEIEKAPDDHDRARDLGIQVHEISYNPPADLNVVAHDYVRCLIGCKDKINKIFHVFLNARGGVLIHCGAGKDRTGVISAMAQLLVGMHRQQVLDDYIMTGHDTLPERIGHTLAHIEKSGGIEPFLLSCDLSPEVQKRIKEKIRTC